MKLNDLLRQIYALLYFDLLPALKRETQAALESWQTAVVDQLKDELQETCMHLWQNETGLTVTYHPSILSAWLAVLHSFHHCLTDTAEHTILTNATGSYSFDEINTSHFLH